MPEIHTHTRNATVLQQGQWAAIIATWIENGMGLAYPGVAQNWQGYRYQLAASMTEEKPRIREMTWTISVVDPGAPTTLGEVWVSLEDTATGVAFSNAHPPARGDLVAAGTAAGWLVYGYDDGTGWSNPIPPATISIPLGIEITDPVVGTTIYDLSAQAGILESANANGSLNLALLVDTAAGATTVTAADLAITELDFFTGVAGAMGRERGDSRVRVARDSRYGMPTWTDELVENEFTEGLWVRAHDLDPEDEYREYVPNPHEGVRDDDVPVE